MSEKILDWLANGEIGISSKCIAMTMLGVEITKPFERGYPLDPDDLHRCLSLIEWAPEIRPRLGEMRKIHPVWAALIDSWDEIEKTFYEEAGGLNPPRGTTCRRTYDLMKEVIEKGRCSK